MRVARGSRSLGLSAFSLAVLTAIAWTSVATVFAAPCPVPKFTPADRIVTRADRLLIVTHPSTQWDGRFSSKAGMDSAVAFAKKRSIPVIYLQDEWVNTTNSTYFFSDCEPDYWFASAGGEFNFNVTATHVYSVGGHWELCQKTTQDDLFRVWHKNFPKSDLTLTQIMDGLYTYGGKFREQDPHYADFRRFMEIVFYGNPRDYWYVQKLSLLESMGIIRDRDRQVEFLKRNLPDYQEFANHEVQLWFNGTRAEVLKKGTGAKPPVLKFEFVNSVYEGGVIPALR